MEKLQCLIGGRRSAAIAGHVNPDGDCVGSCLALYNYLKENYLDLKVDLYLEPFPAEYSFLTGAQDAAAELDAAKNYDLLFALDSANRDRIGVASSLCETAGCVINIDHHISNPLYGDIQIVDPNASSASEIVYELILADNGTVDRTIAEALYLGIMQDTGVFKYSNTSRRTMEIAGTLMETGIDFSEIVDRTFFAKTYSQARILGAALVKSRISDDGYSVVSVVTEQDKELYGASDSDMDGISSQLVNTTGVYAAFFIREIKEGTYKASIRSKTDLVDVNRTASIYGGGGHKRAAGCTITDDPEDAIAKLLADVHSQVMEAMTDSGETVL